MQDRVHDRALLDALERLDPTPYDGDVWRVVIAGRSPLIGSSAKGRWSEPQGSEVLYTSTERDGALTEIGYRLSLEPIWPSKLTHDLFRLGVKADKTLKFADLKSLAALGVDVARYSSFDYQKTQEIAAAANFLEFDGLVAPNARHPCLNLMLFMGRAPQIDIVGDSERVNWESWRRVRRAN